MKKTTAVFLFVLSLLPFIGHAQINNTRVTEFVTKVYTHGIPYDEAKAFGPQVIPALTNMLNDLRYEEYRPNIVSMIGMIGDPSAINPLKMYLANKHGEISYSTFISVLAVFQAFGYIAQSGNAEAMQMLQSWSDPNYYSNSGLNFTYKGYKGALMGSSISSLAIQGLGISGRADALSYLQKMDNPKAAQYNSKLSSSVKSAITLNNRVKNEGSAKVFGKEVQK